ncbi:hypothetical protein ETD83_31520, partial [Actinomadura soli]
MLAGICALAALTVLMAGVPFALLTLFGSPLPDDMPGASDLTDRVGPGALIGILVALVWLAWVQLAVCVVVEVYAGVRGVGVPARVPLAGGTQSLVHRLVVAALLLFSATSVIVPAFSHGGLSQRPPAQTQAQEYAPAAAPASAVPQRTVVTDPAETSVTDSLIDESATTKIYRVQPPEGRHHESLWEIAEKCLGEGRRYKEIFALNKNHIQPDGTRLTIASLIRPGWVLEMPADAKGAKVIPAKDLKDYYRYGHAVPDKPDKPEKPERPVQREKPAQPETPEKPEKPEKPAQPEQPRESAPATPTP